VRPSDASGQPSSLTSPASGVSTPASSLSRVVLPEPFGPRMPRRSPGETSSETPRTTGTARARQPRAGYANVRSRAESKAQPRHPAPTRRGIAEDLFVAAAEQVQPAAEQLDVPVHANGDAGVEHGEAGSVEQSARRAERRLDVERTPARAERAEGRRGAARPREVDRALVPRPPDQRIAGRERRRRGIAAIDREHRRREEGVR